jgi:hypothetical protein
MEKIRMKRSIEGKYIKVKSTMKWEDETENKTVQ